MNMSKRRRASSVASRGADGDDSDDVSEVSNPGPPPSTRKRKKLDPGDLCQQLYDMIRSYKKEDGSSLCDSFIRAPKRRQEPQYYEVVSQPIDLLRVQQKLKTDNYEDIDELSADIELLVNNAKAFYKPDSVEYKDAIVLWKIYTQNRLALENGEEIKTIKQSRNGSSSRRSDVAEDLSETSTNNEEDIFEELFSSVMTANVDGRALYPAFQFLPSKRRYPEYYNVTDQPIDLKTIAQKIQGGEYLTLGDLERDLLLMVRNACHFNEPGSQIYKDAKMLKKVIQVRKQELDQHGRGGPAKTSERIRSKRTSRVGPVPTSRALAIMDPPGSDTDRVKHSEESGDSDEEKLDNQDSPQWKLYETIKNHLGPNGTPMSEPFWKLPSRRAYPDYYKEIKNPVSLNQIRNKIRRGNYGTLSEVAGDMNIMFENAKLYNVPSSRLYKDAVKLQSYLVNDCLRASSRRTYASYMQLEALYELLNEYREVATSIHHTIEASNKWRMMWQEIAAKLNPMGTNGRGAVRTWKGWAKSWSGYKANLKKKVLKIRFAKKLSGGEATSAPCLSEIEGKFLEIIGEEFGSFLGPENVMSNWTITSRSRDRRVTLPQFDALYEFLSANRDLTSGFHNSTVEAHRFQTKWKQIAEKLNSIGASGRGAVKKWRAWSKFWVCYRFRLRKRVTQMRIAREQGKHVPPLGEYESKFLEIFEEDFGACPPGERAFARCKNVPVRALPKKSTKTDVLSQKQPPPSTSADDQPSDVLLVLELEEHPPQSMQEESSLNLKSEDTQNVEDDVHSEVNSTVKQSPKSEPDDEAVADSSSGLGDAWAGPKDIDGDANARVGYNPAEAWVHVDEAILGLESNVIETNSSTHRASTIEPGLSNPRKLNVRRRRRPPMSATAAQQILAKTSQQRVAIARTNNQLLERIAIALEGLNQTLRRIETGLMQQRVQELLDIVQSSSSDDESLSSVKNQAQVNTPRPRGRPRVNPLPVSVSTPVPSPSVPKSNHPLKKKLQWVSRQLVELTCSDGRQPMLLFMEKPSKKLYPEYYSVIDRPIDMITIEANIKNDRYNSLEEMVQDFRLMFSNCRQFNEEGSMIYEDANLLERVMTEKLKELNTNYERKPPLKTFKAAKSRQLSPFEQKLRTLYDAIRDYRDPKVNRQLALIFMKLPSKTEYPDYYELIKNPIDMEKIAHKLKNGVYTSVNELATDFMLMFDNACKYNEPDSQIYKDALILQRVCLQTKQLLREDDDAVPDVPALVQELLLNLFTTVYNHQDEEGRCYSDSMAELPEHDETSNGDKVRAISLDLVKRRLDKGLYKRLDHFQQDLFAVFERARRLSRTDSQIFEDSVELQSYYIEQRDVLCKSTLQSPALHFTRDALATSVELVKQCKLLQETEDEDETRSSTDDSLPAGGAPLPQTQYNKGDFVYIQPEKGNKEPSIVQCERFWTSNEGVPMMYVNVYFRPQDTFHVRTRKFLQQEVFKTEARRTVPLDHVIGPCYVMNVKEYFKYRPEGFLDKDVYVCESRYSTKNRWFKKIKVWEGADKEATLIPRDVPLEPSRTVSVFRERVEKHKDELAELEILENIQEKDRPDVVMYNPLGTDDENTYYEQYNTVCSGVIKTGDCVYVVTDGGKQMIAQVDTIWETGDNKCYFRGPFLIFPSEIANIIVHKPFFKQEVLLTTMHDTSPLVGIVGKCAVLDYDDYLKCRPTEISESDVYVCESVYDESNRVVRKLKTGLRKFEHTKDVTVDEIYYLSKALGPPQLAAPPDAAPAAFPRHPPPHHSADSMDGKPQFTNLINTTIGSQDVEMILENSLDDSSLASPATPLSVGGNSNPYNPSLSQDRPAATPSSSKKKKEQKQKIVTGYILYSSEVRKAIIANNPESTFGEISRIVGNEWRSLPTSTKQSWEERAARCNEETTARLAEEMREMAQHTPMEMTFECAWGDCDYQFEDVSDCMEHCIGDGGNMIGTFIETKKAKLEPGHVQNHYRGSFSEYPCLWRNCARVRKGQAPFPNLPRLLRHVRDLHVNKGNGKMMPIHERSRNFIPSSKKAAKSYMRSGVLSPGGTLSNTSGSQASLSAMSPMARNTPSPGTGEGTLATATHPRAGLDPLFVPAPPRAQRVTHSEAYIRYIEGLHSDQKYITPWEKSLTPMPANPDPSQFNMHKIPAHWMTEEALTGYLAHDRSLTETDLSKMDQNTKILKGLCALRDFLMKDALCVYKNN